MNFNNLLDLATKISTEAIAIAYFIKMRWNGEVTCPYRDCVVNEFEVKGNKIYTYSNGKDFKCSHCKRRFSYKTGTVLENSKISMRKWLMAMYIFTAHKKGISSVQLGKDIGVRQGTAWFMLHRLREVIGSGNDDSFSGVSEVDETYVGGKEPNKHVDKRFKTEKAVVVAIINRDEQKVKAFHTPNNTYGLVGQKITDNVELGSTVITDEASIYRNLHNFYNHETVNHSKNEYVKKDLSKEAVQITTNNAEGFFSLFKRGINGTYHWISKKHLQNYLNEFSLRFNSRFITDGERLDDFATRLAGRVTYQQLINK